MDVTVCPRHLHFRHLFWLYLFSCPPILYFCYSISPVYLLLHYIFHLWFSIQFQLLAFEIIFVGIIIVIVCACDRYCYCSCSCYYILPMSATIGEWGGQQIIGSLKSYLASVMSFMKFDHFTLYHNIILYSFMVIIIGVVVLRWFLG